MWQKHDSVYGPLYSTRAKKNCVAAAAVVAEGCITSSALFFPEGRENNYIRKKYKQFLSNMIQPIGFCNPQWRGKSNTINALMQAPYIS